MVKKRGQRHPSLSHRDQKGPRLQYCITAHGRLGFRFGNPTDGLDCYRRLLESYLLAHGVLKSEMAQALVQPIDFRPVAEADEGTAEEKRWGYLWSRSGTPYVHRDRFGALAVEWSAPDVDTSASISRLIRNGPVLLFPDCFYLPWHPQYLKKHVWMHQIMATGVSGLRIELLDTDADPKNGFRRQWGTNESELNLAIKRLGIPSFDSGWQSSWNDWYFEVLSVSRSNIREDVSNLKAMNAEWKHRFSEERYRSFHRSLIVEFPWRIFVFLTLAKTGPKLCQKLPLVELQGLNNILIPSYRRMQKASWEFDKTGEPFHHYVSFEVMSALERRLESLSTKLLAM